MLAQKHDLWNMAEQHAKRTQWNQPSCHAQHTKACISPIPYCTRPVHAMVAALQPRKPKSGKKRNETERFARRISRVGTVGMTG